MAEIKRNFKDSVFTYLFRQLKYAMLLYLALHPEDKDIVEDDLEIITLENVLSIGLYNDLGLQIRNRLMILVEAQSIFSPNISLRLLMYLAETYKEYVEKKKLSLYGAKKVSIPRPELYVVYTGEQKDIPEELHLSDLYEGEGGAEVTVKVLRSRGSGDILDQYISFCKILDAQTRLFGRTKQAANESIRICTESNILAAFLESRKKEVLDIMVSLFDQEKVWEIERYNIAKESKQEGHREGMQKGLQKGMQKGMASIIKKMVSTHGVKKTAELTGYPEVEIERLNNL